MKLINKPIPKKELVNYALKEYGNLVKAVVDVNKKVMIIGGMMHADEELELLNSGSKQDDLWGINLYPTEKELIIEFDSMINIRPRLNNFSRSITNKVLQRKIENIVNELII